MHRTELRQLAEARLRESQLLLGNGEWSGAYYLSGYAVECGLKAAIARQFQADTFPDRKLVTKSYTHDLEELVGAAGLVTARQQAFQQDRDLQLNWSVVKDWNETARYKIWLQADAADIVAAVADQQHGVMKWLRSQW
ncbi:hypothetical protein BCA37_10870 [Mycobacterium sp. djl-10]|nr:hypothetical protein BCA37_10870 [Mycobacterium sp. djl-10]